MPEVIYRIEHKTTYVHAGPVATSQHLAYLEPRVLSRQRLVDHEILVDPAPASVTRRVDYFGNAVHHLTVLTPYIELAVTSRGRVAVDERPGVIDPDASTPWEDVREALRLRSLDIAPELAELSHASPYVTITRELAEFAGDTFTKRRPIVAAAAALMHQIHTEFTFLPHATTITTPVTRVLADRHGVCQDFAHLQIACLRSLGLAARYVSGYLLTDPPPGQPRLIGADASHAWLSVYCPRLGWVDLDPTNDVVPDARHITVALGRDYSDVSPLRGVVLGSDEHTLTVGVSVIPVGRRT